MKRRVNRKNDTVTVQFDRFDAEMIRAAIYYSTKGRDWHEYLTSIEMETLWELFEKLKMPE